MKNTDFIVLNKRIVTDKNLSAESIAVVCFLLAKYGSECKIEKDLVRLRFSWGNHTWYRVSRELKRYGFVNEVINNKGSSLYFNVNNVLNSSDHLDAHLEACDGNI